MRASLSENINPSPINDSIIRLKELDICAGRLDDITQEGEDFALAMIESMAVEVPIAHAPALQEMVGKRIWLALVKGQIRAGVMS